MKHVDTIVVLSMDVSAMRDKQLSTIRVSFERCKVEGREAIAAIFLIDPCCQLLWCQFDVLGDCKQCFQALVAIIESALVQQGLPIGVNYFVYGQVGVLLQALE